MADEFYKQAKPTARLKRWTIAFVEHSNTYSLVGEVFGHHKEKDGSPVLTSELRTIDFVNQLAEAKNCFYRLEPN